jgi:hypothetical protein
MYGGAGGNYTSSLVAQKMKTTLFKKESHVDGLDSASEHYLAGLMSKIPSGATPGDILQFGSISETSCKYFYYTFAGGIENAIMQAIFSIHGYECQLTKNAEGIAFHSSEPLDFSIIPDNENAVTDVISNHWNHFRSQVIVGPFFNLLPVELRKKEILSQVLYGAALPNVIAFRNANIAQIFSRLF